jgi:hypothetical protein
MAAAAALHAGVTGGLQGWRLLLETSNMLTRQQL